MNWYTNQCLFQVLDWDTEQAADVLYVKTCCNRIVFFSPPNLKWNGQCGLHPHIPGNSTHYSGKFSTLHIPKEKTSLIYRSFSRVSSCGDGQNFMTLPVVHSLDGGKWNAVWRHFWHHETGSFAPRKPRSYRRLIPSNWVWPICCWSGHWTLQRFENAFVGPRLLDTWMKTMVTYLRLAMLSGYPNMSWHGPWH